MIIGDFEVPDEIGKLIKSILTEIKKENAVALFFEKHQNEVYVDIEGFISKYELNRINEIINLLEKYK